MPAQGQSAGPKRRRGGPSKGGLIFLAVLAAALVISLVTGLIDLNHLFASGRAWRGLVRPVLKALVFIGLGLLIGQLIEGLGWTTRLGVLARPIIRRANLPPEAGAAFTAAFASGVAANTLLFTAWQENRLDNRQLVLTNLLNASLPAFLLHLPTTFFVVFALLGRAALVYFGLTFAAALARLIGVMLVGRLTLAPCPACAAPPPAEKKPWGQVWAETWTKFRKRFRSLLLIILPVYLVVFFLAQGGFFGRLTEGLGGWAASSVVPVEAMSVIVFSVAAEFTSGFTAAAALLTAGSLTMKQVVIALIIGNIIATPVRVLRHQLPHYVAIYTPAMGLKLLALGQSVRVASVLLVLAIYIWLG